MCTVGRDGEMTAEGIRGSYRLILSLGPIKQRAFAVDGHVISLLCFFLLSLRLFHSSVGQLRLSLCLPVYESPVAPLTVRFPVLSTPPSRWIPPPLPTPRLGLSNARLVNGCRFEGMLLMCCFKFHLDDICRVKPKPSLVGYVTVRQPPDTSIDLTGDEANKL